MTLVAAWTMTSRVALMVGGLFCFALGLVLNLQSNTGLAPWNAFHYGLHLKLGVTIGEASLAMGVAMMGVSWLLGMRPGVATVANMTLVSYFTDRLLEWRVVPPQSELSGQLIMLTIGVIVVAVGTAIYIVPKLGAGPRDSFMLVVTRRLGARIGLVRGAIELGVLVAGWVLGSHIGLGTVVFMAGIGPAIQVAFRVFRINPASK